MLCHGPEGLQLVLSAVGLLGTGLLSILAWSLSRNVRGQDKAISAVHDDVRAVRSDLRLIDGDVHKHGESIGGLTERTQGIADRMKAVEDDVKKVIRDGCAHRKTCDTGE